MFFSFYKPDLLQLSNYHVIKYMPLLFSCYGSAMEMDKQNPVSVFRSDVKHGKPVCTPCMTDIN